MHSDVIDLRDFYQASLGRIAQRMIRRRIRQLWPDVSGASVLGLGYATPFLRPFRDEAARVVALMPASQGVLRWPGDEPNLVALADEAELPLPDLSIDRALIVHAVETAEQLRPMMREVWRVLAGNGRVVVVAPNRRGLWARREGNPFGSGRSYSMTQLSRLMRDTMFTPLQSTTALYVPPSERRMVMTGAEAWEEIGSRWFPLFGGVVMVEAEKQIYAGVPAPSAVGGANWFPPHGRRTASGRRGRAAIPRRAALRAIRREATSAPADARASCWRSTCRPPGSRTK